MVSLLTSLVALSALLSTAVASPVNATIVARKSTGCCDSLGNCITGSGTTNTGLHWCYGYTSGNTLWSNDDATVGKCMTNLHYVQNDACITTKGSSCDTGKGPDVVSVHSSYWYGHYQLSSDDSWAIQAAMDAAAKDGVKFSDDSINSDGYITFVHTADNGSGIKGLEVYNKNMC